MLLRSSLLLVVLLLAPSAASATVMLELDLRALVGRADLVFVGKVIAKKSRWSEDRRHIVTDAVLAVQRSIHGRVTAKRVVIRSLGGTVGKVGMRVAGSPSLGVGQQLLLFTERRAGHRYVVGMRQGVYRVTRARDGTLQVERSLRGLTLTKRTPSGLRRVAPAGNREERLSAFVRRIRATVAACAVEKDRCRPRRRARQK